MDPQAKRLYNLMLGHAQAEASSQTTGTKKPKQASDGFNDTMLIVSLADSSLVAFSFSCSNPAEIERIEKASKKVYQLCPGKEVSEQARGYLASVSASYNPTARDQKNLCKFAIATNDGYLLYLTASDVRTGGFCIEASGEHPVRMIDPFGFFTA